jgi:microcystin degradation protein MlrC
MNQQNPALLEADERSNAMRVALAGFNHETNTFHPRPTTLADFRGPQGTWWVGEQLVAAAQSTHSVLGGMFDVAREEGWDLVPVFFAMHPPTTGTITAEAADAIRANLVGPIAADRFDGVLLHLHGAACAENWPDPEAVVLRDVRQAVGPDVPIVVVFDLHANIGPEWAEHASAIVGYKTAPHTDFYDRGIEGARILGQAMRGEIRPVVALEKPPVLIKSGLMSMTTAPLALIKPPMFWLMERGREIEREPGIVNVSIAAGFGDADSPVTGMTVLVNADGDRDLASRHARELARLAWRLRRGIQTDLVLTPVDVAIDRALHAPPGTVILADQGNNTAGGSPGDGTAILDGLKAAGWPDAALFIADPDSVDAAWAAGVGAEVDLRVGGKNEPSNGAPVPTRATVHLIADLEVDFVTGDSKARLGRTAVVRTGRTDVVLTQYPSTQTTPAYFRAAGIEPRDRRIVVVQSAHLFRAAFEVRERIPTMIIEVDSPGITSPNASRFTYRNVRRPIFPLDEFDWAGPVDE